MKNINYSPQLNFDIFRPTYSYNNIINMTPQINILYQKQNLTGMKIQNINNNNNSALNRYISYTPYLTKNYSTTILNNDRLNLNQIYIPATPLFTNYNYNCNSNLNINTLYQNKRNSLFSVIKNNVPQNVYSPQTNCNTNRQIIGLKLNGQNQNYDINQSMNNQFLSRNLYQNFNYNNHITNITINNMIPNQNNIYGNKNIQYFVNNNKKDKIQKIEKIEPLERNITGVLSNYRQPNYSIRNNNIIYQLVSPSKSVCNIVTKRTDYENPKEKFDPNEFDFKKRIGEGTYGKIYSVLWKKNNRKYAMKKESIKDNEIKKIKEKTQLVMNFLKKTKCKGVIKIFGDLLKKKGGVYQYYVLMEIADRDWEKELCERNRYKQYYTEQELLKIMNQLIKTLSLMQKNHITHRDIKPQNVLIIKDLYKISDFGEARILRREGVIVSRVRGTELYMSPILFQGLRLNLSQVSHNTFKSDVFSFGMCIFFASTLTSDSLCAIRDLNDMKVIKEKLFHYLSGRYSLSFINILYEMLQIEEHNRPDFITLEQKYFS